MPRCNHISWLWALCALTACSSAPRFSDSAACQLAGDRTERLTIKQNNNTHYLVLRVERSAKKTVFVALDAVGTPQFSATLRDGQLALERSALYRGLDPATLLWGYRWWRLPLANLNRCAQASGLSVQQTAKQLRLWQRGRVSWSWRAAQPKQFVLPQRRALISVASLER